MEFVSSASLVSLKPFSLLKMIVRATEMWQVATFDIFPKIVFRNLDSNINLGLTASPSASGHNYF